MLITGALTIISFRMMLMTDSVIAVLIGSLKSDAALTEMAVKQEVDLS